MNRPAPEAVAADSEPRKRRRPAKSCEQCRQRKVRCDREVPCGPCRRSRSSVDCSYRQNLHSPSPVAAEQTALHVPQQRILLTTPSNQFAPETQPPSLTNNVTRSSIDQPELVSIAQAPTSTNGSSASAQHGSSVRHLQDRLQRLEEQLAESATGPDQQPLERTLRELCSKVQSLEERLSQSVHSTPGGEPDRDEDGRDEQVPGMASHPLRLDAKVRKMKLFGPTHHTYTLDKLRLLGSLTSKDPQSAYPERKVELATLIKDCRNLRKSIKKEQALKPNNPISDLRSSIPAKDVCDELVRCYMDTFEPVYRILHLPNFQKGYQQFWEEPSAKVTPFLVKLILVLAIGTTFHPRRSKAGTEHDTQLIQSWIYAAQWWLTGPTERLTSSLEGIQAFCLLLLARQMGTLGPSIWLSPGSLLQAATAMGLHLDSASFPSLSPYMAEMRARLWTTVLELTIQCSLDTAVPLIIPASTNSKPLCNLNDKDLDPEMKQATTARPMSELTDSSIQLFLHKSFALRAEAVNLIHDRSKLTYAKAIQLGNNLRNTCQTIATFFSSHAPCSTTPQHQHQSQHTNSDLHPTSFHRKFLDMILRRYILLLHLPFMRQAATNPHYHFSRKVCLESAMVIASYANTLTLPATTDLDDFARLLIAGRGSFRGPLSLELFSILGLEIITQLEESPPLPPPPPPPPSSLTASPSTHPAFTNPLDELARATRGPLIRTLEHIRDQIFQIIRIGTPSLKRCIILSAMLAQIRAMERGDPVEEAVGESLVLSLRECYAALQSSSGGADVDVNSAVMTGTTTAGSSLGSPSGLVGVEFGADFDLDITSLLYVPGLGDLGDLGF
ncbi:uncharacterized protein BP01DRAFT_387792 [Aspergillus saccharolyticus JOP 1030-1]|uniref:Zn(2)-C6 fungal-type domain-containing protein n=1 Tax=Aspergillus saccharolyticus JOP 1030-1 TaxID=1450539 RepID=A0A318ZRD1_9EURO|nr:hypothetical protein BP01DRAFT_387792 [Aspergillus saccharolyticus JOP 1030-1]PYH49627.1 hypothetical protein BP01DRAFT_387792 [Aspergillus saccharolyticus JOP 1030-1]